MDKKRPRDEETLVLHLKLRKIIPTEGTSLSAWGAMKKSHPVQIVQSLGDQNTVGYTWCDSAAAARALGCEIFHIHCIIKNGYYARSIYRLAYLHAPPRKPTKRMFR
jgi:hypothetical protein